MKYTKLLKNIGLTPVQSEIMDFLFTTDKEKASIIAKKINRPRGVVYNSLDELLELELIIKKDASNQVSTFSAEHPSKLTKLFEQQKNDLKQREKAFESTLSAMTSSYNLANNKPGVEFYEGIDGVKKVIWDTLTSKTDIYTFADLEKIDQYIKEINAEYAKKRNLLSVQKKIIFPDSTYTRQKLPRYETDNLDIRLLNDNPNFNTIVEIYDNKVSFIALSSSSMIGVIIQDKNIYETQKMLFEDTWKNAKKFNPS